ncbi:SDR family oxidoreductase [Nocardia abscessus]|uniref:SDR family oxidoreductase n=1 Tax=Nocardia abscessus TaxID=120957 RepID=UPI001893EE42|nr:SDR family oxidoreductase [Nocardia abscessus]MBF6221840.1 SDR family oxidoreductase [Nocardia abscessus]
MRVVIAGGHGKIALLLAPLLTDQGHEVAALIRNPEHADDVRRTGAEPVLCDLENVGTDALVAVVKGCEAAIFAAGAGQGSGVERKYTVDLGGSVRLAETAEHTGARRFLQISTMGAGRPPAAGSDEVWAAYVDAKTEAENDLRSRDLDWTILRPGRLTDSPGTGLVTLAPPPLERGEVARADVAAVLAGLLPAAPTAGTTLELISGGTPISQAIAQLAD